MAYKPTFIFLKMPKPLNYWHKKFFHSINFKSIVNKMSFDGCKYHIYT